MAVSRGTLPEPCRLRQMLEAHHCAECGVPMEELEVGLEELKGFEGSLEK